MSMLNLSRMMAFLLFCRFGVDVRHCRPTGYNSGCAAPPPPRRRRKWKGYHQAQREAGKR